MGAEEEMDKKITREGKKTGREADRNLQREREVGYENSGR